MFSGAIPLHESAGKRGNRATNALLAFFTEEISRFLQILRTWASSPLNIRYLPKKKVFLLSETLFSSTIHYVYAQLSMDNSSPVDNATTESGYGQDDIGSTAHVADEYECLIPVTSDKASKRKRLSRACDRCRNRKVKVLFHISTA